MSRPYYIPPSIPVTSAGYIIRVNSTGTSIEPIESVPVANGGTGATNPIDAQTNLGLRPLTDNSVVNHLHRHSELVASDGSPDPAVSVDAAGNVGIGTSSPNDELEVSGAIRLSTDSAFVANEARVYYDNSHGLILTGGVGSVNDLAFATRAGQLLITNPKTTNDLALVPDSNGNVGIGTTAPNEKLAIGNGGNIVVDKSAATGIKVDNTTPTFGWADLLGDQFSRNTGATKPTLAAYNGAIKCWQFGAGDEAYLSFHLPHDYVKGSDLHVHIHWSHNSTTVTGGSVTFRVTSIYAKGHNQGAFNTTPPTGTFVGNASTTRYRQIITEVPFSSSTPTGIQIDTDLLEPDGVIEMTFELVTNSITSSAAVPDPFIHYVDIHYQTTGLIGTKDKAPDFYT